jgi:peptide/nickel transport system permease protein
MHISIQEEFRKNGFGQAGLVLLAVLTLVTLLASIIAPLDPHHQTRHAFEHPSALHILGTNHVGQDNWSRLAYGARTSLMVGFFVACSAILMSVLLGVSCALKGGLYDALLMRLVDALIIIPAIIILIIIFAYLKPTTFMIIIVITFFSWPGGARILRAQTLSLKERTHIWAARSFGGSDWYILRHHIVPDLSTILVVEFIHAFRRGVFMEAGLAFLGIGDPTTVSWGTIMRNAVEYSYMNVWPWWLLPAGLALSAAILSFTFIGHTLEPIMEPRLREEASA